MCFQRQCLSTECSNLIPNSAPVKTCRRSIHAFRISTSKATGTTLTGLCPSTTPVTLIVIISVPESSEFMTLLLPLVVATSDDNAGASAGLPAEELANLGQGL